MRESSPPAPRGCPGQLPVVGQRPRGHHGRPGPGTRRGAPGRGPAAAARRVRPEQLRPGTASRLEATSRPLRPPRRPVTTAKRTSSGASGDPFGALPGAAEPLLRGLLRDPERRADDDPGITSARKCRPCGRHWGRGCRSRLLRRLSADQSWSLPGAGQRCGSPEVAVAGLAPEWHGPPCSPRALETPGQEASRCLLTRGFILTGGDCPDRDQSR